MSRLLYLKFNTLAVVQIVMVSVLLKYITIFLAKQSLLCLMLLATYYAQNYAGIIGWSLNVRIHGYDLVIATFI